MFLAGHRRRGGIGEEAFKYLLGPIRRHATRLGLPRLLVGVGHLFEALFPASDHQLQYTLPAPRVYYGLAGSAFQTLISSK